jgi:hypothetical protein
MRIDPEQGRSGGNVGSGMAGKVRGGAEPPHPSHTTNPGRMGHPPGIKDDWYSLPVALGRTPRLDLDHQPDD